MIYMYMYINNRYYKNDFGCELIPIIVRCMGIHVAFVYASDGTYMYCVGKHEDANECGCHPCTRCVRVGMSISWQDHVGHPTPSREKL